MTPVYENALQDRFAPKSICFGCGPVNAKGLRIKSFAMDDGTVVAEFTPESHHEAFPGMVNGGIIGSLLDCHSNWTACYSLMKQSGATEPPCTVTADFHVKLKAPTPSGVVLKLSAQVLEIQADRAKIKATIMAGDKITATCEGMFVAVKPGHPAYHRWAPEGKAEE